MKFSVLNFHMGWGIASVLGKAKAPFLPAVGPFPQGRLQRVEGRLRREEGRPRLVGRHQLEDLGRLKQKQRMCTSDTNVVKRNNTTYRAFFLILGH